MRRRNEVRVDSMHQVPYCRLSREYGWPLAEYLSLHRTQVAYSYAADHFTVSFFNMNVLDAQRLMDEWAASDFAPTNSQTVQMR